MRRYQERLSYRTVDFKRPHVPLEAAATAPEVRTRWR